MLGLGHWQCRGSSSGGSGSDGSAVAVCPNFAHSQNVRKMCCNLGQMATPFRESVQNNTIMVSMAKDIVLSLNKLWALCNGSGSGGSSSVSGGSAVAESNPVLFAKRNAQQIFWREAPEKTFGPFST